MTEEEYFRKNYPNSCYGDKPLSPYWDYFQEGVEFGERQSEKKIEELEKRVWRQKKKIVEKTKKISDLEKEIKQWKDEWQEQVQKATDEGFARILQTMQLSKAKEIIKNLMVYVPVDLKEYEEAKQFINSEVENG